MEGKAAEQRNGLEQELAHDKHHPCVPGKRADGMIMNGRTSRLQTFLVRFGELKAAAGNDPKALCSFDQTTAEIRAAAKLIELRPAIARSASTAGCKCPPGRLESRQAADWDFF